MISDQAIWMDSYSDCGIQSNQLVLFYPASSGRHRFTQNFMTLRCTFHSEWIITVKATLHNNMLLFKVCLIDKQLVLVSSSNWFWLYMVMWRTRVVPACHPGYALCSSVFHVWKCENVWKAFTTQHGQPYCQKTQVSMLARFDQCQLCCWWSLQGF